MVVAFGNATEDTAPWVASPTVRGTWELLSSCLITISLCVWTALHLNVPEHGTSDRQWLRKTKWLVLGLVAPEMVVYVAWRQRFEARRLLRDVRKEFGQSSPPSRLRKVWRKCCRLGGTSRASEDENISTADESPPTSANKTLRMPKWSLAHGFFAVMGGFALDSSRADEAFLPAGKTRAALTAEGLRFFLKYEPDSLPDISQDQINDKSIADGLKKFIVCFQAIWFCASCITRLVNSLPISLLELNTMGHAACALLIYAMWWQKPLDISEPALIQVPKLMPLMAYMWMSSGVSAKGYKSYDIHGRLRDEFDALWMYRYPSLGDLLCNDESDSNSVVNSRPESSSDMVQDLSSLPVDSTGLNPDTYPLATARHYKTAATIGLRYRIIDWLHPKPVLFRLGIKFPAGLGIRKTAIDHMSPPDVVRWRLAHEAIARYGLEHDIRSRHYTRSDIYDAKPRVKARINDVLSLFGSRPMEVWFGFAVAGLFYGGLHLLAWNAPFSSRIEQILWRVAASSVTITPLIFTPFVLIFDRKFRGHGSRLHKDAAGKR